MPTTFRRYEGDGRRNPLFDPRMLVEVLLYAYATGTQQRGDEHHFVVAERTEPGRFSG